MSANRKASAPRRVRVLVSGGVALLALVLSGCDAADPHVPAVVRAPASVPPASPVQAVASQNGLAPPVIHTVD
ncbi:hypothetical protein LMG7141_03148 [Ralstonia condita]|uniref:Uncharacterized protein n=1 Tax=Ralstonia condita TaxID=3058600 RepID=A0ABM9JJE0_9RALS|nr:hypothetical protein [Ralstonia sp. LMG 7141]MDE2202294.1 hypothetical protein [Burkholderiaceae bacterium]CAJ0795826.1 hypothetical protein LMG7141_03148 [Ralstonia sp. LMG 7141]